MGSTKTVNTILLGAEILKVMSGGISRLEDIYPLAGLSKSTTHRVLKSLAQTGLAYQNPLTRTYHIGPLLLQLSATNAYHHLLILCASGELRRLHEVYQETALLIIPMGDRRLVLRELPSSREISFSLGEGSTMSIFQGSAGRVLLSQYDDRTLQQLFSHLDIPPTAPSFMSDPDLRMKKIDEIRQHGYSLNSGELRPDVVGIAVPVKGYVCPVALCLFGPKFRYRPLDALKDIRDSAERISAKLLSVIAQSDPTGSIKSMQTDKE